VSGFGCQALLHSTELRSTSMIFNYPQIPPIIADYNLEKKLLEKLFALKEKNLC
jgi:hypothetical protein